ncbi:unnamed protein product [Phytophthora lilii]|uniref:Unnamed protein product n=1 Tax=Phytophthora lilii TaxID=2077276 RepID=A0A9W6TDZ2_9STRA|nr:unnamed protein product [Phytophthora lilii]
MVYDLFIMSDDGLGEQLYDQEPNLDEDFGRKAWPFSDKGELESILEPKGDACIEISNVLGWASEHSGVTSPLEAKLTVWPTITEGCHRERFRALQQANATVSVNNRLQFYIAELCHEILSYGMFGDIGDWDEEGRKEEITWYFTYGEYLGDGDGVKLNFLNPQHEKRCQLWKKPYGSCDMHGYLGNDGLTKESVYRRYAVVAWPLADNVQKMLKHGSVESAVQILKKQMPVDKVKLRVFMEICE